MTSERSQAYGRVAHTLTELGPVKLLAAEQDQLREAADTLLFCEDPHEQTAIAALHNSRALIDRLIASGRWSEERAGRLTADLEACGPLIAVG
jgi:hypothetical protein